MTIKELKTKLDELNISEELYSLYGNNLPETTVLDHQSKWLIYRIYERGIKGRVFSFNTETEACEYFYQMMKKDKEREDRINNMSTYVPPLKEENHTFIVSETSMANIQKEKR
jgi:hypothetical protein